MLISDIHVCMYVHEPILRYCLYCMGLTGLKYSEWAVSVKVSLFCFVFIQAWDGWGLTPTGNGICAIFKFKDLCHASDLKCLPPSPAELTF